MIWTVQKLCLLLTAPPAPVLGPRRQFNHKPGSQGVICLRSNSTAMLQHDALHDGQSEAGAAVASGKVGLKEPSEITRLNSLACIRDLHQQQTSFTVMTGLDRNSFFPL